MRNEKIKAVEVMEVANQKENLAKIDIKDKELNKMLSWWTCDACGGDSEDGCQMSDPEDCVRS